MTTGADIPNTFAQVTLHNFEGIALTDLVGVGGPTFTTDNYAAGSPRYVIDLDNGDSLWGYPPNWDLNGSDFAWAIDNGNTYEPWSDVLSAEPGAKVTGVVVVADGDQESTTDVITDRPSTATTSTRPAERPTGGMGFEKARPISPTSALIRR